ncbi:hypothetical protein [Histidinibacterium lentulum]|uniref:Uncharacterized protein n=1 Tax=Histidinibacterium lentulum TaxID=2480588 RepID=A0A3N2R7P1_9RHOB|nr:hypothetical protein [Histidinibacterium lentulum]ROU03474.1 hypothetical protein EAT49_04030 [Histidinibacterium lentulum]
MIELAATRPTSNTFAVAVGAAMLAGQFHYPPRVEAYEVQQVRGTYSDFMESLAKPDGVDHFAQQIAAIYNSFAERQGRLGAEFEAAIFSDLESLYEG